MNDSNRSTEGRVSDAELAEDMHRYRNNKAGSIYRLLLEVKERRAADSSGGASGEHMTAIRSLVATFDSQGIDSKHCIDGIRDVCSAYLRGRSPEPGDKA